MEKSGKILEVEYFHGSKFGNGLRVAEEFKRLMGEKGKDRPNSNRRRNR